MPPSIANIPQEIAVPGRTRPVSAPVTVAIEGNKAVFDGAFVLKRGDFAIGEGAWADFGVIANEIRISFHVVATGEK